MKDGQRRRQFHDSVDTLGRGQVALTDRRRLEDRRRRADRLGLWFADGDRHPGSGGEYDADHAQDHKAAPAMVG
jgi:hypothetical protein